MKKLLCCFLALVMLFALVACKNTSETNETKETKETNETEYHPSGFDGDKLYVNTDGKTLVYERYEAGVGSLTRKTELDTFYRNTEIEGIVWCVFSTEEYPDLSYVLVISGTNASWTYRILQETP